MDVSLFSGFHLIINVGPESRTDKSDEIGNLQTAVSDKEFK